MISEMLVAGVLALGIGVKPCSEIADMESQAQCEKASAENNASRAWSHSSSVDPMSDETMCRVEFGGARETEIRIVMTNGGVLIYPTGDQFPGSRFEVRVDKLPARGAREAIADAEALPLLSELQKGSVATVRYTAWPSNAFVTLELPLAGIGEQLNACRAVVGRQ